MPSFVHRLFEEQAVFGDFDRLALRADHLDAEFFKHARFVKRDREIQRRLPADGRQQRIGPFLSNDRGDGFDA